MIKINNSPFELSTLEDTYPEGSIERKILDQIFNSKEEYTYEDLDELKFEIELRKEIVDNAILLYESGMNFSDFENSRCNDEFWERTDNGGFKLKEGVNPSDAINDIFINGDKYATECATAMVIVYYKALLNVFKEELFNKTFKKIYLLSWDVREPLLEEVRMMQKVSDVLLGDRQYFSNPDFNPNTPQWQGENVIVLDDDKYYGHGIGILNADGIIKSLNLNRKPGATQTAYLMHTAGRPNFKKLFMVYRGEQPTVTPILWHNFPNPVFRF